jgi:RecB family exonuclease
LTGFIDLLAHDPTGRPAIVDYKTGRSAGEDYALQFALYAYAVRNEYPAAQTLLLRIGDDGAAFEPVVPAEPAALRAAIARAKTMETDEPRPGAQCSYCPYAHDICQAAPPSVSVISTP